MRDWYVGVFFIFNTCCYAFMSYFRTSPCIHSWGSCISVFVLPPPHKTIADITTSLYQRRNTMSTDCNGTFLTHAIIWQLKNWLWTPNHSNKKKFCRLHVAYLSNLLLGMIDIRMFNNNFQVTMPKTNHPHPGMPLLIQRNRVAPLTSR